MVSAATKKKFALENQKKFLFHIWFDAEVAFDFCRYFVGVIKISKHTYISCCLRYCIVSTLVLCFRSRYRLHCTKCGWRKEKKGGENKPTKQWKLLQVLYMYHYDVDKFMNLWQIAANSLCLFNNNNNNNNWVSLFAKALSMCIK